MRSCGLCTVYIFVKQDEKPMYERTGNAAVPKILFYMLAFLSHTPSRYYIEILRNGE